VIDLAEPSAPPTTRWRAIAALFAALLLVGVALGAIWSAWSPATPAAILLPAGTQADETENFTAADGRFALLTGVVGILAGVLAWSLRSHRGALVAAALAAGGLGGSLLTDVVGRLIRGDGPKYSCGSSQSPLHCTAHLPLSVQMHGLLFLEAGLAVLIYSMFVAFAADDDLGRPDPVRAARQARSVGPQDPGQHPGPYGDGTGAPQQHDFAPQYPHQPQQPPGGGEFGQQ
jgi:hypothetical protein